MNDEQIIAATHIVHPRRRSKRRGQKALIICRVVSALALSGVFADKRCLCPPVARSAVCLRCGAVTLTLAHGPPIRLKSAYRVALSLVGVIASN